MEAWRGRSVQPGTPGLPPGPLAYATMGSRGLAGVRPDAAGASMSPMTPPVALAPPLLSTTAPRPSSMNLGASSSAARPSQPTTGPEVDPGVTLAGSFANALGSASSGGAGAQGPQVQSAFELLGRKPPSGAGSPSMDTSEAIVKALTMAVSGERKSLPTWAGNVSTLRAWLRQLSFWEIDNQTPKHRWGIKLYQAFAEGSVPRRIAETLPMDQIMSEQGYGLLLTAVLEKFRPYLEAAGPAAVDAFFFQGERARAESFANFMSAKEIARQEVENMTGERIPPRIAGRILLRQANLSESQREAIAIKYNALLSFEEVAVALRPLDRPEALMKPIAGTASSALATASGQAYEWEYDEEHLPDEVYYEDEWQGEHDGEPDDYVAGSPEEGTMFFEMDREYDEDEALYIWAYNDAYQQLVQDSPEGLATAFPAYSDVRKELQARRKGRQFFKPEKGKGKGRGRSSGKGHRGKKGSKSSSKGKGRNKGTTEDLMATTRCFSCGELGHFSRDCPAAAEANPAGRTNFVLSQGPSPGSVNRTFMTANPNMIAIYAGVRTSAGEGLVDTAAEDAVIGSSAFDRLCQTLAGLGLRPVRVSGPVGACAGIGGSAQVAAVWDVPIGIAQTNGLLRVTVVTDTEGFETPFLIPISFQELVGMLIDIDKGEIRTRAGTSATMHRLPTGHRAVSVVDFKGRWALPKELLRSGRDPFQLPRGSRPQVRPGPIGKHRGVTVWLRQPTGQLAELAYVNVLEGERKSMVLPSECLPPEVVSLQATRVTFLDTQPGCLPYVINDSWSNSLGPRALEEPWTGTVVFQQASSSSTATPSSESTTPLRQAASPLGTTAAEVRRFSLSDESELHSSAAWDFEGVFSSVSGGEQQQRANSSSSSVMHAHPQPPRQQDVWSQMQ